MRQRDDYHYVQPIDKEEARTALDLATSFVEQISQYLASAGYL